MEWIGTSDDADIPEKSVVVRCKDGRMFVAFFMHDSGDWLVDRVGKGLEWIPYDDVTHFAIITEPSDV